ncbi:hypothetical protein F0562_025411 [Nyssa sinensis]|uniref:Uncharacterized protein n=1 Tax=Nyssa sinensis TaxID=561372 RepID=A0A5J5BFK5_9ASTE|nr:hypothetical protein F0562_025411 [Nyssa sinensis]
MAGGAMNEALRDRVTHLENFVGVPEDDDGVSLSASTEQHAIELVDLRKILDDFMTETNVRINNIMEDVMSLTDVVKINLKSLEDDVALVKKSSPYPPKRHRRALVEIKLDITVEVPDEVADLLKEFADVMPPELPKSLSPRRATDHKIDLD